MVYGIDVAQWQGVIDWSKVKKDFAILKVTKKSNGVEPSFERNYNGCLENHIPVGVYRYVYAKTVVEAKKEAEAIVKILGGRSLPYGVWLDMEDKSIKIGKSALSVIINTEAEILKAAGYSVGIYCNKDWYYNVLDGRNLAQIYPFWIARYPLIDTGKFNEKSSLNPKNYAIAWQYSSKGKVDGIKGNVDMDVMFVPVESIFGESDGNPYFEPKNVVTSKTQAKIKGIKVYSYKGNDVGWVQWHLWKKGYLTEDQVDLSCGPITVDAIMRFQSDLIGLAIDGLCGSATRKKLKEA